LTVECCKLDTSPMLLRAMHAVDITAENVIFL